MKKYLCFTFLVSLLSLVYSQNYYHIRKDGAVPKGYFLDKIYESTKTILLNEPSANVFSKVDAIPFPFTFFGNNVRYYKASDNGYLSFDTSNTISQLPDTNFPKNSILGFWDDFKLQKLPPPNEGVGIQVYSYTVGEAPNRSHIVQFFGLSLNDDLFTGPISNASIYAFAIVFHEQGNGRFDLIYTPFGNRNRKAGIGCVNVDGTQRKLLNDSISYLPFQFSFETKNFIVYQFYPGIQNEYDLALENFNVNAVYPVNSIVNFSGRIKNIGSKNINSLDLNYSVNQGDTITHSLSNLNIEHNGVGALNFSHPISWTSGTKGSLNNLHFWISNPNGQKDQDTSNSEFRKIILRNASDYVANKNIMIEEATGAWCGYCPDANLIVDEAVKQYGKRVIPVSYHNEDSMSNTESEVFLKKYFTSYPDAMLDRNIPLGSTNTWVNEIGARLNAKSPVQIDIQMKSFNVNTREIQFTVRTTFNDYWYGNMNLGALVTEDDVRGVEAPNMWSQYNYYSKAHKGGLGGVDHPLYNELEYMHGYKHQHVFKSNTGEIDGLSGVIPQFILPKQSFTQTFSYILPEMTTVFYTAENNTKYCSTLDRPGINEGWNVPAKVNLVGFVSIFDSLSNEYTILNVNSERLWNLVDINQLSKTSAEIQTYPNPLNNGILNLSFNLNNNDNVRVSVLDVLGNEILKEDFVNLSQGQNHLFLNLSNCSPGIYFVNLQGTQLNASTKINVE
jgi:thiol-disulfide isomerase/thioredoxin